MRTVISVPCVCRVFLRLPRGTHVSWVTVVLRVSSATKRLLVVATNTWGPKQPQCCLSKPLAKGFACATSFARAMVAAGAVRIRPLAFERPAEESHRRSILRCRCAELRAHSRFGTAADTMRGKRLSPHGPRDRTVQHGSSCRGQCRRTSSRLSWRSNIRCSVSCARTTHDARRMAHNARRVRRRATQNATRPLTLSPMFHSMGSNH